MTQPKEKLGSSLLIKLQSAWIKFEIFNMQHMYIICTFVFFATVLSHGGDDDDDDGKDDGSVGRNQAWDQITSPNQVPNRVKSPPKSIGISSFCLSRKNQRLPSLSPTS